MESGFEDETGNESKKGRGRPSRGLTEEEKRQLKITTDRKFRANKAAEFRRLQTRENELSASLEDAFEKMEHMKAENERSEKEKNEAVANVQMLQNQLMETSAALQYMTAENQSLQERVYSMIDMLLNQNGNKLPELPEGFFDGLVLPNDSELQEMWNNNVPNELGAIQTPNTMNNAEASTSTTHSNEENVKLQKEVDELKRKVEVIESALFRITAKP